MVKKKEKKKKGHIKNNKYYMDSIYFYSCAHEPRRAKTQAHVKSFGLFLCNKVQVR